MFDCLRCHLPLYHSDSSMKELVLCCLPFEKVCPSCLSDNIDLNPQITIFVCSHCGRSIKVSDIRMKYNLYLNNRNRMVANSNAVSEEFNIDGPNQYQQNIIDYNKNDAFRTNQQTNKGCLFDNTNIRNYKIYNNQESNNFKPKAHQWNNTSGNNQFVHNNYSNFNKPPSDNVNGALLNRCSGEFQHKMNHNRNQAMIQSIQNLVQQQNTYELQSGFNGVNFRNLANTCHSQQKSDVKFQNHFQQHFEQNNYFQAESINQKIEPQREQRCFSSHSRIIKSNCSLSRPLNQLNKNKSLLNSEKQHF